jgi:hypothetical protein
MSHSIPIVGERSAAAYSSVNGLTMKTVLVPLMLLTAGILMSFAWIGHLKFKYLILIKL